MLSTFLQWFPLVASLFCVIYAVRAARYSAQCTDWMVQHNTSSASLKQLAEIQTELTDQADTISVLSSSMKKLRSRIGMRELRAKGGDNEIPDSKTDPDGYKRFMRQKLGVGVNINAK